MNIGSQSQLVLAVSGLLVVGPQSALSAQGARRPPDNPAGNVNSHVPDAQPTLRVRYVVPWVIVHDGLPDTAGVGTAARDGSCIDVPLASYLTFASRTAVALYDSTATFCSSGEGSGTLTRRDSATRRAGDFTITGREFSASFIQGPAGPTRLTGWFAGDTLYLDQDCDAGGLPYVREARRPSEAQALHGVRWSPPCG